MAGRWDNCHPSSAPPSSSCTHTPVFQVIHKILHHFYTHLSYCLYYITTWIESSQYVWPFCLFTRLSSIKTLMCLFLLHFPFSSSSFSYETLSVCFRGSSLTSFFLKKRNIYIPSPILSYTSRRQKWAWINVLKVAEKNPKEKGQNKCSTVTVRLAKRSRRPHEYPTDDEEVFMYAH